MPFESPFFMSVTKLLPFRFVIIEKVDFVGKITHFATKEKRGVFEAFSAF